MACQLRHAGLEVMTQEPDAQRMQCSSELELAGKDRNEPIEPESLSNLSVRPMANDWLAAKLECVMANATACMLVPAPTWRANACKNPPAQAVAKDVPAAELERAKKAAISSVLMNLESRAVVAEDIGRQVLTYGHRCTACALQR